MPSDRVIEISLAAPSTGARQTDEIRGCAAQIVGRWRGGVAAWRRGARAQGLTLGTGLGDRPYY